MNSIMPSLPRYGAYKPNPGMYGRLSVLRSSKYTYWVRSEKHGIFECYFCDLTIL